MWPGLVGGCRGQLQEKVVVGRSICEGPERFELSVIRLAGTDALPLGYGPEFRYLRFYWTLCVCRTALDGESCTMTRHNMLWFSVQSH